VGAKRRSTGRKRRNSSPAAATDRLPLSRAFRSQTMREGCVTLAQSSARSAQPRRALGQQSRALLTLICEGVASHFGVPSDQALRRCRASAVQPGLATGANPIRVLGAHAHRGSRSIPERPSEEAQSSYWNPSSVGAETCPLHLSRVSALLLRTKFVLNARPFRDDLRLRSGAKRTAPPHHERLQTIGPLRDLTPSDRCQL
jgi:hypothetical protein